MLNSGLIVKTSPVACEKNILLWGAYRVTVLGDKLFRLERSPKGIFRDEATQAVWFRDMPKQNFTVTTTEENAIVDTGACKLILGKTRGQVRVELNGKSHALNNKGNLLGTYRTLDGCSGGQYIYVAPPKDIELSMGVCSKTGVAVLDDSASFTLGQDGEVKNQRAEGSDEYIFAYGDDYRGAVNALYELTGHTPLVPRFALGNWWSRYHVYTDKEYLRVLSAFDEREIPVTVATIDMDWHYSERVDEQKKITASGKNKPEYIGGFKESLGWTGYSWNTELFPDYKSFLEKIKDMGLKITLNIHPSSGIRFWEEQYGDMAKAVGMDPASQRCVPFDFTYDTFINAYFDILHLPYEKDGVDFWWIDWQQPDIPWHGEKEGKYDPLWALNHYHYYSNAEGHKTPLLLSRYAGIGSHRYPLGFSGDTSMTWETLAYLPYFTATATNVGYTWWSHDIGGHHLGFKENEMYARHVQYGVFSPINRLHCTNTETMTKEPWMYQNGAGLIVTEYLRLRHRLIPYLYTASYDTHVKGQALVEPLYYEWKTPQAYEYSSEYRFGSQLLVAPVTTPREEDGYARVKGWIPEGTWTDIFTGDEYSAGKKGKEVTFLRSLENIPVLVKEGGILPLSMDKGRGSDNPENLEIWSYLGKGEYTLYEDGKAQSEDGVFFTKFTSDLVETKGVCTQSIEISSQGDCWVLPKKRTLSVRFKNAPEGEITLFVDGEKREAEEWFTSCPSLRIPFEQGKRYRIELRFKKQSRLEKWQARAKNVLIFAEGRNEPKRKLYQALLQAKSEKQFLEEIEKAPVSEIAKLRLKETV